MNARFRIGLLVGKFCPLHRGHQRLIDHAFEHCDEVILLSYTRPEFAGCEPERRERWLQALYPRALSLVLDDDRLALLSRQCGHVPRSVPGNSDADAVHHEFIGWLCVHIMKRRVDAVFTSESYGDNFATALSRYFSHAFGTDSTVIHVCCDPMRRTVPISGTQIRADPHRYRGYLARPVYADFIERVALLGGESSGKTTLADYLAKQMQTTWAAEYARELWMDREGRLAIDDMLHIAQAQIAREEMLSQQANRWLFCDTTPLTTLFYSQDLFGKADPVLTALAQRRYDHVFLCAPDFDFVQDGTRRGDAFRTLQHQWYARELKEREIQFSVLTGSTADRSAAVLAKLGVNGGDSS